VKMGEARDSFRNGIVLNGEDDRRRGTGKEVTLWVKGGSKLGKEVESLTSIPQGETDLRKNRSNFEERGTTDSAGKEPMPSSH